MSRFSLETRYRMSLAKKGKKRKPFSEETKAKMRESQKKRREAERKSNKGWLGFFRKD